jgi:hypothetical protein
LHPKKKNKKNKKTYNNNNNNNNSTTGIEMIDQLETGHTTMLSNHPSVLVATPALVRRNL